METGKEGQKSGEDGKFLKERTGGTGSVSEVKGENVYCIFVMKHLN